MWYMKYNIFVLNLQKMGAMNKRPLLNICILHQLQGMKQVGLVRVVRNDVVIFPGLPESPYYGRTAIHWFLLHSFSDSGKTGELRPVHPLHTISCIRKVSALPVFLQQIDASRML